MRRIAFVTLALLIGISPSSSRAAECVDPPQTRGSEKILFICHPSEEYWKTGDGWKPLPPGATLRVPTGKTAVEVRETNTAVFRYELASEPVDAPEAKRLDSFLKKFGPYLTDVLSTEVALRRTALVEATEILPNRQADRFADLEAAVDHLDSKLSDLEQELRALEGTIDTIRGHRVRVLGAYRHDDVAQLRSAIGDICSTEASCRGMAGGLIASLLDHYGLIADRLEPAESAAGAVRVLADRAADDLEELTAATESQLEVRREEVAEAREPKKRRAASDAAADAEDRLRALSRIERALERAEETLADVPKLLASARKALEESGEVIEQVRTLERLLIDGVKASSTWRAPGFPVTLQKGRKVTLKITPRPVASIAAAGRLPTVATSFTLQPVWPFQPAVGLLLLYAEGATFSEFGTAKRTVTVDGAEAERFEIVEKEIEDHRFEYGLTLSLTREQRCWNDGRNCPWLDLTVNPSDDVRALGAGLSVNFGRLRIGAGAVWTKHDSLEEGLALGDLLGAEGDLKTGESYDDPDFYVSFSVTGWQPFVSD